MKGKLYGVGIGPGDPELLTLKAANKLKDSKCIIVPKSSEDRESLALSIISAVIAEPAGSNTSFVFKQYDNNKYINIKNVNSQNFRSAKCRKEIIELIFPMSKNKHIMESAWNHAANEIKAKLDNGIDVAFATLGDPSLYSTYMYIHKKIVNDGYEAFIIPGVPSFCACCAAAGVSLAEKNEKIAIVPLSDLSNDINYIDAVLQEFENIVFMKVSKSIAIISEKLKQKNLFDKAVVIDRCSMPEQLLNYDIDEAKKSGLSYFSTLIVKKNGVK